MKRATMRQIAQMVGVSAMTVSKALGNKPGVSEETRKRVVSAAEKLRYTPNMLATSFRTARTNTIGVVMASSFEDAFTMLFRGIEAEAKEYGYSTLVATTEDNLEREQEIIRLLVSKRIDGLILTSGMLFSEKLRLLLEGLGVPYVLAVRTCPDTSITTVANNNFVSAYSTVDYLARTGSKRFLLIPLEKTRSSSRERFRGWTEALAANSLTPNPALTVFSPPSIESGREITEKCLQGGLNWDTVVCGNDHIAIGSMEAMLKAGVAIPGQVRVAGYDGIPLSAYLRIPLTTVQQPLFEIGQASMRLLKEKIRNPLSPAQQVLFNGKLVIREST